MATKINKLQGLIGPQGVMNSSWLEQQHISRSEQVMYVKSGWLRRIATGVYQFANSTPTLFGALHSLEKQMALPYRIAASTALELHGYTHYVVMGKPQAFIATPVEHHLPKWMKTYNWDRDIYEFSTKIIDDSIGSTMVETDGLFLCASSPELAIMECLLLTPTCYTLMDIYHLMEMLTTLRPILVSQLLEKCSSVKVKRQFLYMAEKANHRWFSRLDLTNVTLGSGPRSFEKGGVKIKKYNIIVPRELADYE